MCLTLCQRFCVTVPPGFWASSFCCLAGWHVLGTSMLALVVMTGIFSACCEWFQGTGVGDSYTSPTSLNIWNVSFMLIFREVMLSLTYHWYMAEMQPISVWNSFLGPYYTGVFHLFHHYFGFWKSDSTLDGVGVKSEEDYGFLREREGGITWQWKTEVTERFSWSV